MTPELQKYYEARFDLTSHQGWHDLLEDIDGMIENYSNLATISTVEELYKRQGQLDILNWIKSLREISQLAYEELNETSI
jgi:uncharacterized protein YjgD (DUF1641 family)